MRFLHLSDLHIGKRVNEFSMLEDQKYIFRVLLQIIDEQKVEGVWIAGDVFDKSVPSAEAVQVFDDFLTSLASRNLPLFIISGNHDSAERIAYGGRLLAQEQVYLSPVYSGQVEPVILQDDYGEIGVYMLPFVKPAYVKKAFPDVEIGSYQDAVKQAVTEMDIPAGRRNILIAHQLVTGATRCESEEISVGGLDNVDVNVFEAFDYVALGHIHGPQKIGRETVRYAGTPLKYSFSECRHHKAAVIVDIQAKGDIHIQQIPLVPLHDMQEIRGTYMEVTARDYYQDMDTDDYMHITLTDEEDIPDAVGRLRAIYPNLMRLDYDNTRTRSYQTVGGAQDMEKKSELQLLQEFYELQNNQKMSEQQEEYAVALLEKLKGGRA